MTRRQSLPMLALPALAMILAALLPVRAAAQEARQAKPAASADSLYCEQRRLGYWFYCVKPVPAEEPQAPEIEPVAATQELDAITAELRELKARAIVYPTEANVAAYIRLQRAQLDRASLFSDVWQRAIWQDPELDYTLERPVGALAKKQWQDARSAERDSVMARLSQRYGLFYFYSSTCAPCEVMSPIVKGVAERWRITVRATTPSCGRWASRGTRTASRRSSRAAASGSSASPSRSAAAPGSSSWTSRRRGSTRSRGARSGTRCAEPRRAAACC